MEKAVCSHQLWKNQMQLSCLMNLKRSLPVPIGTTAIAVVPIGTGSDLIKSLHTPKDLLPALRYAAFGEKRTLDVGKAIVSSEQEVNPSTVGEIPKDTKYFLNVAGFGANGEVVRRANSSNKRLGNT